MNKTFSVTQEQIDQLMNTAQFDVQTIQGKCTVVSAKLENGFILTESSGCVDPANYDEAFGAQVCRKHIENKLWELEGYVLQKTLHEQGGTLAGQSGSSFGWAIDRMRCGFKVCRRGWNGRGIYIAMQVPDANSKMTSPYIYIDTTGLMSDNADAPRSMVPWLASQTDMLAEDWELYTK